LWEVLVGGTQFRVEVKKLSLTLNITVSSIVNGGVERLEDVRRLR
jgi:hypothetical protein